MVNIGIDGLILSADPSLFTNEVQYRKTAMPIRTAAVIIKTELFN
jgi:hypothetical protein